MQESRELKFTGFLRMHDLLLWHFTWSSDSGPASFDADPVLADALALICSQNFSGSRVLVVCIISGVLSTQRPCIEFQRAKTECMLS